MFKQSTYDFSTSHDVNMVKKSLFKDRGAILDILQEYEEIQPSSKRNPKALPVFGNPSGFLILEIVKGASYNFYNITHKISMSLKCML